MEDQEPPLETHEITEAKAPAKPMPDAQPANEAAKTEEDERGLLSMMVSGLGKFFSKKERPDEYPEEREVSQETARLEAAKSPPAPRDASAGCLT